MDRIFDKAREYQRNDYAGLSDVERAIQIFVLLSQSFNNRGITFAKRKFKNNYEYRKSALRDLELVHKRLEGVQIFNKNALDILGTVKEDKNAFIFLDPPYRHELRGKGADKAYRCELDKQEHIRLLEIIQDSKAKIALCGYKSQRGVDLYDKYLIPNGWRCYKIAELPKSTTRKDKLDYGKEFIWVNYELPNVAKYFISVKEYNTINKVI